MGQQRMGLADPGIWEHSKGNTLRYYLHPGQQKAYESTKRFVCVLAGTQGGKTCFGPPWLLREIRNCGQGDYMVVTPTFQLLEMKALPEFRRLFETKMKLGQYRSTPARKFLFSPWGERLIHGPNWDYSRHTTVSFGYAADPDSLESATAKAAWLDEAGQKKFKLGSYEAILRRLSLSQGRVLITTTPYDLGWIKQKIWDPWQAGNKDIDVVRFESIMNPAFPLEEYARARKDLPRWRFDLFYRAVFTRPAGLIYDCFDHKKHTIPRFSIPRDWQRYIGIDFGGTNTAAMFYALEPHTDKIYAYREYLGGNRTVGDHKIAILAGEPGLPTHCIGGSKSEGQWRREFAAAGLPVGEPSIKDVEVGINRVLGCHSRNELFIFNDLENYLYEKMTYSRKLDGTDQPTDTIEDKHSFHLMDAERYILGWLCPSGGGGWGPLSAAAKPNPGLQKEKQLWLGI